MTAIITINENDHEVTFNISGSYVPESKWARNGDPGSEAEFVEVEILSIDGIDWNGLSRKEQTRIEKECEKSALNEVEY